MVSSSLQTIVDLRIMEHSSVESVAGGCNPLRVLKAIDFTSVEDKTAFLVQAKANKQHLVFTLRAL